jgi:hypothetical protein
MRIAPYAISKVVVAVIGIAQRRMGSWIVADTRQLVCACAADHPGSVLGTDGKPQAGVTLL